jgi:hypothetical protein
MARRPRGSGGEPNGDATEDGEGYAPRADEQDANAFTQRQSGEEGKDAEIEQRAIRAVEGVAAHLSPADRRIAPKRVQAEKQQWSTGGAQIDTSSFGAERREEKSQQCEGAGKPLFRGKASVMLCPQTEDEDGRERKEGRNHRYKAVRRVHAVARLVGEADNGSPDRGLGVSQCRRRRIAVTSRPVPVIERYRPVAELSACLAAAGCAEEAAPFPSAA